MNPDPREVADVGPDQVVGERLSHWIPHILVMKDAVEVWDLAARKDVEGLQEVQRSRKLFTEASSHRSCEPMAVERPPDVDTASSFESRLDYYQNDEPWGPSLRGAWAFVMDAVEQHLKETGPMLTMRGHAAQGTARLYVVPTSLLGAMWIQFAEAISEQKDYARCKLCGKPFEVSTAQTGFRTNRRFCSDVCKNQFHYQKRQDARQLLDQGVKLKEIAERFGTTGTVVKKWLRTQQAAKTARTKR